MLASPLLPEVAVPETARRWIEESKAWLRERQARGNYTGRNGYEAERFLAWCGERVESC